MFSFKKLACLFCSVVTISSCNNDSTVSNPVLVPIVWGRLSAIMVEKKVISGNDTIKTSSEQAMAAFILSPAASNTYTDAGTVTLNNISLIKSSSNNYFAEGTTGQNPANLGLAGKVEWHVSGNGDIPSFSFIDVGTFPSYLVALPFSITKSAGLGLVFDSTTVAGADSVRVQIDDASGNIIQSTFSAKAGSVTIPSSTLSALSNVSDQTAVIAIMPYAGSVKAFLNKGMYFIRERRLFQSININ